MIIVFAQPKSEVTGKVTLMYDRSGRSKEGLHLKEHLPHMPLSGKLGLPLWHPSRGGPCSEAGHTCHWASKSKGVAAEGSNLDKQFNQDVSLSFI